MLQPSLDDHVLGARLHPRHLEDLFGSVMHPLKLVKTAETQPNDTTVLIQCEIATTLDSLKCWWLLGPELNHLSSIQERQLFCDLIPSAVLLPRHVEKRICLHLNFSVRDLFPAALSVYGWSWLLHVVLIAVSELF